MVAGEQYFGERNPLSVEVVQGTRVWDPEALRGHCYVRVEKELWEDTDRQSDFEMLPY